jgi:hypothetical protein
VFDCEQPTMKALKGMDTCWDDVPTVSENYARARDAIRTRVTTLIEQMIAQAKS